MTWRISSLPEIVNDLARRPGHEAVRTSITDILRYGFNARLDAIDHEVRMPAVRGRIDHMRNLSLQAAQSGLRIVDAKAGTLFSAAVLSDQTAIVGHMAFTTQRKAIRNALAAHGIARQIDTLVARLLDDPDAEPG